MVGDEMTNAMETPVLLLSVDSIKHNYEVLTKALPNVEVHYAVKSNDEQTIIDTLAKLNSNFDVCSIGELDKVLRTGANPASLIHSHPIKTTQEFDWAVGRGVEIFVVDNVDEVKKLNRYMHHRLKVLIRFRVDLPSITSVNLQYKFGCQVSEVISLAKKIQETGQEFYGLCFHVGSQCLHPANYVAAITAAGSLINGLRLVGLETKMLDIGGGFPVKYTEDIPGIEIICDAIKETLKIIDPKIKIACEPGRFISANTTTLVCSVIGKAIRDGKLWYYLDDGVYSTFSGIMYDHAKYPILTTKKGNEQYSVLAGPTCDSIDVIDNNILLPELEIGDKLTVPAVGSYCSVSSSNFNSIRKARYKVVDW